MKNPDSTFADGSDSSVTQDETFLRRWSKRKLEASTATEERVDAEKPQQASTYQQTPSNVESETDQPQMELTDADMPPLETLDENSDYSGFFSPKVSETL